MDINLIQKNLNTKHNILYFETIDSTNAYCKEYQKSLKTNTLIIASTQSLGRGKNNRVWFSPIGGIYFSILLKNLKEKNSILPLITSLAITSTLKAFNIESKIKWPNDIIVNNKKLGGILVESKISTNSNAYIIGIGLNIRSLLPSFEIKDKFIALNEVLHILPKSELIISTISNEIEKLLSSDISIIDIISAYKKNSILIGKKVYLSNESSKDISVNIIDVNIDGTLKVQNISTSVISDIFSGEFSITGIEGYI